SRREDVHPPVDRTRLPSRRRTAARRKPRAAGSAGAVSRRLLGAGDARPPHVCGLRDRERLDREPNGHPLRHPVRSMSRATIARSVAAVCIVVAAAVLPAAGSGRSSASEIRVPQDAATLQLALAWAEPGDTIVLDRGVYPGGVTVPGSKHDLTIRGV